jgi:hypothetical protein
MGIVGERQGPGVEGFTGTGTIGGEDQVLACVGWAGRRVQARFKT